VLTPIGEDRLALSDLVNRYAYLVDAARFDEVSKLYVPDGVLVTPVPPRELCPVSEIRGHDAIVEELRRLEPFAMTFHGLLGQVITAIDDDHAHGRVNCVAHHVAAAGRNVEDLVWHLRYDDRYVRAEGDWLLERRAITIELIESRPVKRANDRSATGRIRSTGAATA
jgi:hypothetical protein